MSESGINQLNLPAQKSSGVIDSIAKKFVLSALSGIDRGRLIIEDEEGVYSFGAPVDQAHDPIAKVNVRTMGAYRSLMTGGSIGAGEAYMAGQWQSPDLVSVVRVLAANLEVLNSMHGRWPLAKRLLNRVVHLLRANTKAGSERNIAAHYDLSNEFFALFLDSSMMYSAAVFPQHVHSLEQASFYKLDLICRKLQLTEDDHLLEIGTGWGGLAIHAAKHYGCRVTTTTISNEQYQYAKKAVEAEALEDRITLLLKDYRDLDGSYDKLVSIEMIEAVGHSYYESYFKQCSRLLKKDGLLLIQAITIADQRFDSASRSVDFIQKYIFPGGALPSVNVIASSFSRFTNMVVTDLHDIGIDYADTLKHWRLRFLQHLDQVRTLGFDEQFCRMWEYYMAYCEGGFRERAISTVQIVAAKPTARHIGSFR